MIQRLSARPLCKLKIKMQTKHRLLLPPPPPPLLLLLLLFVNRCVIFVMTEGCTMPTTNDYKLAQVTRASKQSRRLVRGKGGEGFPRSNNISPAIINFLNTKLTSLCAHICGYVIPITNSMPQNYYGLRRFSFYVIQSYPARFLLAK